MPSYNDNSNRPLTLEQLLAKIKAGESVAFANLRGAYLRGAYLGGAYLDGAYLGGANLRGAYLRGANLGGAYLSGAYLDGAYLRGANLGGAYLSGAYLDGAYLGGAYLGGANLRGAYLDGAYLGSNTVLPLGATWGEFLKEILPQLVAVGGVTASVLLDSWECRSWQNCPMAVAFGVHALSNVPALYRAWAELFVTLFDSHLIKAQIDDGVLTFSATVTEPSAEAQAAAKIGQPKASEVQE